MTTWVIVADASRARVFSAEKSFSPLVEVEDLTHPEARLHEQDLQSDRMGRAFDSTGDGRHAMGKETPPKKHEALRFARTLCDRLNNARATGQFSKLYIIAAPAFLGALRNCMDAVTQKSVAGEIDKNLTTHDPMDIRRQLPQFL
ncbi:Host attachment protein [Ectothiorhodospira shaposhnikovii]|uniref:host attachment protein n=1 Tax=Ectothiorhodospira shaposhnikovii TaxID=1054 RepID=UPI0019067F5B|nr:host attachment protein [Ectothiorhodospira shaposhnikovii]MBK1674318.1 Host attachment protein [Ectothiorhodospira shaposhnikovii]